MTNTPQWVITKIRKVKEKQLKKLNLSDGSWRDTKLTKIPPEILELEWLEELDLSGNNIPKLPNILSHFPKLRLFGFRWEENKPIPDWINLVSEVKLDFSDFKISNKLPDLIFTLNNLKHLDLSKNQLTSIPDSIIQITKLKSLNLKENQLTSIPDSISKLTHLNLLNLRDNQLTSIPDSISKLTHLNLLNLKENQLTSIPDSISKLIHLNLLDLSENQLTSIPDSISKLTNLKELDLNFNQLTSIPNSISKLTHLNFLYLSSNELISIPDSISKLTHLKELYLSSNQLTSIPDSISKLTNLNKLYLEENPLEKPPIEIVEKGINAIREYFQQLAREGLDYLYEAKLLIVGEPGAGKTTLSKKIENQNYQLQDEDSTKGIEVIKWNFPMDNGKYFRVNIWDFGGQEIYHTTHQFFLTKRSLYALVADTRKEDTDFYYWLNIVELLTDRSPLLIIKNEKQNRHREINDHQLRGRFENLKETLATNLATNSGLDTILQNIKHHIKLLPHIGSALPKTWMRVREVLENDSRNYISLEEYVNICEKHGLKKYKDKLQLSEYLHDLGICLHFQDDPVLNNTVILKPKWGTDAVYRVLDDKQVINNLGKFSWHNLKNIWQEEQYAAKQGELLRLMCKFKLCYELPHQQGTYIAPQLLTENQPEYDWDQTSNLILRYTYEFMPKGIITQFIVAIHQKIYQQKYVWKTGILLNQNQTKAEVIEFYDKREIKIRVTGKYKRDLMTNVTYELDKIHDSYKHLKYQKLIPCNCSVCKSTQSPYFYKYDELRERHINHKYTIECGKPPYNTVEVLELIDDVFGRENFLEQENKEKHENLKITKELLEIAKKAVDRPTNIEIQTSSESKAMNNSTDDNHSVNINQHHSGNGDNIGRNKNTNNNSNNNNRSMKRGDVGGDFSLNSSPKMSDDAKSKVVTQDKNPQLKKESKMTKTLMIAAAIATIIGTIATIIGLFSNRVFNDSSNKPLNKDTPETFQPK